MAMEDPQFSSSTLPLFNYRHSHHFEPASPEIEFENGAGGGDLLFAWLTPIGTKVDKRLRPKSPQQFATLPSPLTRARSAFRRTLKAGHVSHKLRVREANDACLWLKAAGFPQYVQMFEDGRFPINLSKFRVEKDHAFLEQADIDSLIRRLNILNRCADIMEGIKSKDDDSDDDGSQRALSDQWHFRRKNRKWSRKGSKRDSSIDFLNYSSEDLLSDSEANTSTSSLMLVSELRGSLTGLDRAVKTYSFLPTDDQIPKILVDSPEGSPTTLLTGSQDSGGDSNGVEPKAGGVFQMGGASEKEYNWDDDGDVDSLGSMDNFANGILDEFESNLLKWKTQSLPDIFASMKHYDGSDTSSETSLLSSASASTNSMAGGGGGEEGQNHKTASQPSDEATRSSSSLSGSHQANNILLLSSTPLTNGSITPEEVAKRKLHVLPPKQFGEPVPLQDRHQRFDSIGSTGTFESQSSSLVGSSEGDRRESRGGVSASPLPFYPERQYVQNELGGRGSVSPVKLRPKRASTGSEQQQSSSQARWHSYQQPHGFKHTFKPVRTLIPIEELSVGQISVLRKLSLIKLTALIELYKSKCNISRILKVRKQKPPDIKYKRMFGVPLSVNIRNTGQALPPAILHAIQHLRTNGGLETKGIFRRAAGKAKIELLKVTNEANPANSNYENFSVYDIADMIKLYFRELPESVLTTKLSEMLIIIQQNIPSQLRLQAFQSVMLLMPDGNREALQTLLLFLKEVASNSAVNQMDAQNLAVCFAPSLFALTNPLPKLHTSNSLRRSSFRRAAINPGRTHMNIATSKEVNESVASSNCLAEMISHADKLFTIAADMLQICKFTHLEAGDPIPFHELGLDRLGMGHYTSHLDDCAQTVLKEARRKFKGWVHFDTLRGAEMSFLKPNDGVPLKTWRAVVEVGAPCEAVLKKIWKQRLLWTGEVQNAKVVSRLDEQTEVIQYVSSSPPPLSDRDHCLLRHWQYDVSTESYVIVSMSVSHPCASLHTSSIRATELATRYLIEPLTKDSSRLTFISRVDMRGHSAEYYNQSYGAYLVSTITNVARSFQEPDFLETTV